MTEEKFIDKKKSQNWKEGAVTFLDVLGWKGIYHKNQLAVISLTTLIEDIRTWSRNFNEEISSQYNEIRGVESTILSISDTIAIFTPGKAEGTIALHSKICKEIIPASIKAGIPIRGAISYGEYSLNGNIMVGPAVDEAASWHETTEWIGVHLSPTAQFSISDNQIENIINYQKIPYKKATKGLIKCVEWEYKDDDLHSTFSKMGPHTPEIASKYLNTIEFLNNINKK